MKNKETATFDSAVFYFYLMQKLFVILIDITLKRHYTNKIRGHDMNRIIKNAIKCNHCGDIIVSRHRYDFITCKCGCCSVDGGNDYLRREFINSPDDFTELSEYEILGV